MTNLKAILAAVDKLDDKGQARLLGYLQGQSMLQGELDRVFVSSRHHAAGIADAYGFAGWFIRFYADSNDGVVEGEFFRECLRNPAHLEVARSPTPALASQELT
jgi:hypothetical protein